MPPSLTPSTDAAPTFEPMISLLRRPFDCLAGNPFRKSISLHISAI